MDGLPKSANKSKYDLDGGGGQVSLLIRLSHKVRRSAALDCKSLTVKHCWPPQLLQGLCVHVRPCLLHLLPAVQRPKS